MSCLTNEPIKTYNVLGVSCLAIKNIIEAEYYLADLIESKQGGYSVAINAEKIVLYNKENNGKIREVIDKSNLPTPDGAGAVLAMKWLHKQKCIKLDLPKTVFNLANKSGFRMFLLGSSEDTNFKASETIKMKYPHIEVTGRHNGYFSDERGIFEIIRDASPQIVMVALGSPKQEIFSAKASEKIPGVLFVGCGGALDVLAGNVKRAPAFFTNNSLEWLYRLIQSPKRIKRQLALPVFFIKLLREVSLMKFSEKAG